MRKIYLSIIASFLCLMPLIGISDTTTTFTIYYLDFDTDYYVPPTPEHIERTGLKIENYRSKNLEEIFRLYKKVSCHKNDFVAKGLRVEIIDNQTKDNLFLTAEHAVYTGKCKSDVSEVLVESIVKELKHEVADHLKKSKKRKNLTTDKGVRLGDSFYAAGWWIARVPCRSVYAR